MSTGFQSYVWTEAETLATNERGLRFKRTWDYFGRVRGYLGTGTEYWILKSVDSDSSELDVLKVLLSCGSPKNHTVPAEIIPCGGTHLILMPYVETLLDVPWTSIDEVIDAMEQCLTGLRYMHELGVAHLDLHDSNLVYATESCHEFGDVPFTQKGRAYFIDFGLSKRFPALSGYTNGRLSASFQKGYGHYPPPEGTESVNPYAYDVYCMGWVADRVCKEATWNDVRLPSIRVPPSVWVLSSFLASLDPKNRPSATHALALMRILRIWVKMTRWMYWFVPCHQADRVELCGWRVILWLIHCGGGSTNETSRAL